MTTIHHVVERRWHNAAAVWALCLGLATFVTLGATGIPALACGTVGIVRVRRGQSNAPGMAWTGAVLGGLAVGGWTLVLILGAIASATHQ